ncbi:MAG: tyrosine-type recombinase/integrase, partial [Thermales bacterium]|nr:tyrosine-type recombinase/integrase [Thermales bacterium]
MLKNGSLVLNPDRLELPKTRMRRIEFLTDTEISKLIESVLNDITVPEIQKKRNQAIILTLFGSGLRLSELLALKKVEVSGEENQITIEGKGGKIRSTYLAPASKEVIREYLQVRGGDENPFLFISHSKTNQRIKI